MASLWRALCGHTNNSSALLQKPPTFFSSADQRDAFPDLPVGSPISAALLRVFHKLWLGPIRVQKMMAAQGIKGPPYRFLHGTTEEILRMRKEDMETPMDYLSHDISPRIQPHVHTWVNTYATVFPLADDPDAAPRCGRWEDAIDNLFGFGEEVFGLVVLKFTGNGSGGGGGDGGEVGISCSI
ncbi:hypothetical protein SAY87_015817 [Trapa incisa]|uniref:Uncharacterized protein n=1 Tax=Trapa incisa TaxID=236973 RepID=A0AAN7L5T4_9MYRT|nr:hypothetical protein SAY87_015817 [Trapa incisa]